MIIVALCTCILGTAGAMAGSALVKSHFYELMRQILADCLGHRARCRNEALSVGIKQLPQAMGSIGLELVTKLAIVERGERKMRRMIEFGELPHRMGTH